MQFQERSHDVGRGQTGSATEQPTIQNMQCFIDHAVFLREPISLKLSCVNQGELIAHGSASELDLQGLTPKGSDVPSVGMKLRL
ncbi:hypothetical protein D9M71_712050 [compost metagenome]